MSGKDDSSLNSAQESGLPKVCVQERYDKDESSLNTAQGNLNIVKKTLIAC
jgi:hypothetical protein